MRLLTCYVAFLFLLAYIMSNLRKLPEDFPFAAVDADLLAYSYRPEACAYTCPFIRANALPRILIQKKKKKKKKERKTYSHYY